MVDKIRKKEEHLNELTGEYQKLIAYKTEKPTLDRPPETQEEDQNRKVTIFHPIGMITTSAQYRSICIFFIRNSNGY